MLYELSDFEMVPTFEYFCTQKFFMNRENGTFADYDTSA